MKILKVQARANHQMVIAAWATDVKPPKNCLGFAATIIDAAGNRTDAQTRYVFKGEENKEWKSFSTREKPIQRFIWRFLSLPADWTGCIEIAPVYGTPADPQVDEGAAFKSNTVTMTASAGDGQIECYWNRGYPSMQALVRMAPKNDAGDVDIAKTKELLGTPGSPLRKLMSAGIEEVLMKLAKEALTDEDLELLAAIYEYTDTEVVECEAQLGDRFEVVLSDIAGKSKTAPGENDATKEQLDKAGVNVHFRRVPQGSIAHNKTRVLRKKSTKKAVKASVGSTNTTRTGIGGQLNQHTVINIPEVAQFIQDYIERLIDDTVNNGGKQGRPLRDGNNQAFVYETDGGKTKITIFCSPNSDRNSDDQPIDMAYLDAKYAAAQESIYGCVFQPGKKSVVDFFVREMKARPYLVGRFAVSSPMAMPEDAVMLYHRSHEPEVVQASSIKQPTGELQKEVQSFGFAIIHAKEGTIDSFGAYPVTYWGTHNDGEHASKCNDEVMVVVEGDGPLSRAVASMFMCACFDTYDHNRERWLAAIHAENPVDIGILSVDNGWCKDETFEEGTSANREMLMWAGLTLPGNDVLPNLPELPGGDSPETAADSSEEPSKPSTGHRGHKPTGGDTEDGATKTKAPVRRRKPAQPAAGTTHKRKPKVPSK